MRSLERLAVRLGHRQAGDRYWLAPQGLPALMRWHEISGNTKPDDLVFPSERGTFLSRDNFLRRNIQKKLATVGLGWVNFQVLRRTQASLGHMEGIDPKVAADQRGHGIGVAIDTYTTTDVESRREAVTRLEVALKDEEGTRNSKGSPRQGFRGKQGKGEFGGRS